MAEERQENSLYKVGDEVFIRATVVTVDDGLAPSLKYEVAFSPTQKIWVPQSADIRLYNRVAGNEEALTKITTINSSDGHVILDGIEVATLEGNIQNHKVSVFGGREQIVRVFDDCGLRKELERIGKIEDKKII